MMSEVRHSTLKRTAPLVNVMAATSNFKSARPGMVVKAAMKRCETDGVRGHDGCAGVARIWGRRDLVGCNEIN